MTSQLVPAASNPVSVGQHAVSLDRARFIALTTFRASGEPVSTPVLFVEHDDGRLRLRTADDTGKVRRIRVDPRVTVAPSDSRGRTLGDAVPGTARILGPDAYGPTLARLHGRYRIAGPLFTLIRRLRGQRDLVVEVTLDRPVSR